MQVPPVIYVNVPTAVSGWQIGSTVATAAAALVALVAVYVNMRQRRADQQRAEQKDLASARARARLVRLGGRPVWEPMPDNPDGRASWGIELTNLDDRTILDVRVEFWTRLGFNGDPTRPNVSAGEVMRPEQRSVVRLDFGQDENGVPPGLTAWRIRWSDVDGYDWCFDHYGQKEPARYTGQPPMPSTF